MVDCSRVFWARSQAWVQTQRRVIFTLRFRLSVGIYTLSSLRWALNVLPMSFPVSLCFPPPPVVPPNVLRPFRNRPRGLWKARVTSGRISTPNIPDRKEKSPHPISDTDDEPCSTPSSTLSPRPCKKPRTDDPFDSESSLSDSDDTFFLAYASYAFDRESGWQSNSCSQKMDTSSTARASTLLDANTTCDFDDWEDLKELFARVTEQYEGM